MLKYEELVNEIRQHSLKERLSLLEVLAQSIREEIIYPATHNGNSALQTQATSKFETPALDGNTTQLSGLFKSANAPAPTDEELHEDYTNYLMEKYK